MASGKSRTTKRSSGSSTTTIFICLALSALLLWLLTSNTFAPPHSTSRASVTKSPMTPPVKPVASRSSQPDNPSGGAHEALTHEAHHVDHEDIPTHIPDAVVIGKSSSNDETTKTDDNTMMSSSNEESEPKSTDDSNNTSNNNNNDNNVESKTEDNSSNEDDRIVKTEEPTTSDEKTEQETKKPDSENEEKQNETTDELDNEKRVDNHQTQEDDQIRSEKHELQSRDTHGAISHDQVEHDEAKPEKPRRKAKTKKAWSTQADHSDHEKERRKSTESTESTEDKNSMHTWRLCNVTAGADYIPCLDNEKAIAKLRSRKHHEHRERHCPDDAPTCLVPLPQGYKTRIDWPQSRDKIWLHNVPHTMLAQVKGHQNWVKVTGEFLTFPGGGTQFIHGALHYIDFVQEAVPEIAWGKRTRVVLDVGCGVASLGGYLFERDVIAMSFAPKDEHEAQVQMALERGIPAISAVMGSQRLPFPSRVFDVVHCARCRVPWHADGGALLLELNRVLRPGGYFVWSATPVYQKLEEDVQIWNEMSNLTLAMCWELVTIKKDALNSIGAAVYQKPDSNECYEQRKQNEPPMCKSEDDPNAAWYIPLQSCMHKVPMQENERGSQWPEEWPDRLLTPPYWLNKTETGVYGKPGPDDFVSDYKHWKKMVSELYMDGLGVSWSHVRNVMDMRAVYGGFAAALKDLKVWVMNVVNVDSPDTLPLIYERGLFGIYHDWCESFSTYPRTYDLLHADHLFSTLKKRCKMVMVMSEVDRIARPGGILIVRDDSETIGEVDEFLKSMHWEVHFPKGQDGILAAQKSSWRPDSYADRS